ncbi:MAG: tripartite tricarboxylate transporter substrate binding protein [Synechococcaceae bacterium WB9_2_112]|nr:tripartite tricarboxylate transporter substrate binding protein [Synechococcaceae bacterium WB9_2_112]
MLTFTRRTLLGTGLTSLASPLLAQAGWPTRQLSLVVGFPPGGPNDLVARQLAVRLGEQLKQTIVVENKPGANGNIAAAHVARAPADGHTLLYNSSALALSTVLYPRKVVEPLAELTPVTATATLPLVCVVAPDFPAKTYQDWIAQVHANPGKFNYGSPGAGNLAHVVPAMILKANGLSAVHAPHKGSSEALQSLMSGAIQFQFDSVNSPLGLIRSGKVKALFVTSLQRSPALPNVPTMAESGAANFDMGAWQGVMAPAGTPAAVVQRLADEIGKAMNHPDTKRPLGEQGTIVITGTPQRYATFIAKAVDAAGIKLDS